MSEFLYTRIEFLRKQKQKQTKGNSLRSQIDIKNLARERMSITNIL